MGTINFSTGDFLTLANEDFDPFKYTETEYEEAMDDLLYDVKAILNRYSFNEGYFKVTLEYGYYDGFSVTVDEGDWSYFDDMDEKNLAYKAVRDLQECLTKLAEAGMISCCPGWCTTYKDYKNTLRDIRKACSRVRMYIRKTPTYRTYVRRLSYGNL